MTGRLRTRVGEELYGALRGPLRQFLVDVDAKCGVPEPIALTPLRDLLKARELDNEYSGDEVHDDLFVLARYLDFFEHYGRLWRLILDEKFSESWRVLQDAADSLRLVKKFSSIDVNSLDEQLAELERTYPYGVFFSIGALVERFDCSICGEDIDSTSCAHRRGCLYRGRMAHAVAHNKISIDHIAIVDQPQDRRCVVAYDDSGEQFALVRFLANLLATCRCRVSDFGMLQFSKSQRQNPEYRKLGRNEPCFCSSGRKFKHCCINKQFTEGDHVDITPRRVLPERAVA
jgi:hypothetical protein